MFGLLRRNRNKKTVTDETPNVKNVEQQRFGAYSLNHQTEISDVRAVAHERKKCDHADLLDANQRVRNERTNSAIQPRRRAFAFAKLDVDRINKIAGSTARTDRYKGSNGWPAHSTQHIASPNELVERQRRILSSPSPSPSTTAHRSAASIDGNKSQFISIEDKIKSNELNEILPKNSTQFNRRNAKSAVANTTAHTVTATATKDTDANTHTVINEVKYRSLGNLPKTKQQDEQKRQNRLSLTSLGFRKSNETNYHTFKSLFSRQSTKNIDRSVNVIEQTKNEPIISENCDKVSGDSGHSGDSDTIKNRRKGGFFSDIFMARGRNRHHNKSHSNTTTNTSTITINNTNTPTQQQQQTQLSLSCKFNPNPTNPAATAVKQQLQQHNHNNNNIYHIDSKDFNSKQQPNWPLYTATHLETSGDPSTISTNSYQMTRANNSCKNFRQVRDADVQRTRCSSAEPPHHQSNNSNVESPAYFGAAAITQPIQRSRSVSLKRETTTTANIVGNTGANADVAEQQLLHRNTFIHAQHIERNGVECASNANQDEFNANEVNTSSVRVHVGSAERQLDELAECDRDHLLHNAAAKADLLSNDEILSRVPDNVINAKTMGQGQSQETTSNASSTRSFRETSVPEDQLRQNVNVACEQNRSKSPTPVVVPTITVVDYGGGDENPSSLEKEVFYDFDNENEMYLDDDMQESNNDHDGLKISAVDEANDDDDEQLDNEVFHEQQQPQQNRWSPTAIRYGYTKLANVPEQEENAEQSEEEEDDEEDTEDDNDDDEYEHEEEDDGNEDCKQNTIKITSNNLDTELTKHCQLQREQQNFDSPERSPLKSANTSDSNLSTNNDSGVGDSVKSNLITANGKISNTSSPSVRCSATPNKQMPFVRDGNSTDCEETLLQFDDELGLDYGGIDPSERLVCIESISLPDVVVESTNSSTTGAISAQSNSGYLNTSTASGDHIININGATSNNIGGVHFIPIHVEGATTGDTKRRSFDDSSIGMGKKSTPIIEITEDESVTNINGYVETQQISGQLKRELLQQNERYTIQIDEAHKNVQNLQSKIGELQAKIQNLEQELSVKAWNVDKLQAELTAAHKDDEFVRQKLKVLENEKTELRHKFNESEDEFLKKYDELELRYQELEEKYKRTQQLASNLQTQLATAQSEAEEWRQEVTKIRADLEEQIRILENALQNSEAERKICEDKWQREFEILRTQNMDREETLMRDCEWQMRQMQQQCKDKLNKSECLRKDTLEKAKQLEEELEEREAQVKYFQNYEAEVKSLRGVVSEQEQSIQTLMAQIKVLTEELTAANANLEQQIEAVKKIKYQCDNTLRDKERQMIYRIDEVRYEAANFWESKLYSEMTRLKNELESVFVEDRRDALDKLQEEHIEELRAVTTRYTANEEELRTEFAELQERFDIKNSEFLELRDKTDNALLQTRMHLDRADRDYQNAMCREEERREALEESLRKEFEDEKADMEKKFLERLTEVKNQFLAELASTTQELLNTQKEEMDKQKSKLQSEKDEALQELNDRYRKKLAAAEDQMKDIELRHQHDLKDLKAAYDAEKAALDKRDISNAQEIEQLHRKCRCLTNLFEEMRMRYERREPRAEDLREIDELRSRCESQERDLYDLTEKLREMQIQMANLQQNCSNNKKSSPVAGKQIKKPPPKTIPTSCDVIYEENEESEDATPISHNGDDGGESENENEDNDTEEEREVEVITADTNFNGKNINFINDDDTHMITTV